MRFLWLRWTKRVRMLSLAVVFASKRYFDVRALGKAEFFHFFKVKRVIFGRLYLKQPSTIAFVNLNHKWIANWLILPEVICLSQRLSHACVSSRWLIAKLRTAHYNSTNLFGCSNSKRITAVIRELILAKSVARRVFPFLKSIVTDVFWGIEGT